MYFTSSDWVQRFIYQRDNDPELKVETTFRWFNEKQLTVLQWLRQTSYLSPPENLMFEFAVWLLHPPNLKKLKHFYLKKGENFSSLMCQGHKDVPEENCCFIWCKRWLSYIFTSFFACLHFLFLQRECQYRWMFLQPTVITPGINKPFSYTGCVSKFFFIFQSPFFPFSHRHFLSVLGINKKKNYNR